ncbi:MAG: nucleotidyltransferase domain-containing protein [Christensenellaceae bacterium]|jgi:predicted nucleotidyltransferase|nr:nucleotidyltransferase domain-containing protein [Christensenellaceae bacterium]
MAQALAIKDIKAYVTEIAKVYDIRRVSLFGSYAKGEQTQESDIDLLVDFGDKATYLTVFDFQNKVENKIGKDVDVIPAPIPQDSFLKIDKEVLLYERSR